MTESIYKVGGSLPEENKSYVIRDADEELYNALEKGEYCYVLDARQTGKSSLCVRTMARLKEKGIARVFIDISKFGENINSRQWYFKQVNCIRESLNLPMNSDRLTEWWDNKHNFSDLGKYESFLEEFIVNKKEQKVVIFIDEIDTVLSLDFTDDFFIFIRSCYNERTTNQEYKRLTFCLLGVASPNNLIKDKKRTPFNISQGITLKPFPINIDDPDSLKQIQPLIRGLEGKFDHPQKVMAQILSWTGGQPFLTQKLCKLMVEESEKENRACVEDVVRSRIIENWEFQDEPTHLKTIRDRILMNEKRAFDLLKMYRKILSNGQIDANSSYDQIELKLTGLVLQDGSLLKAYNPIYKEIFNLNWVEVQLEKLRLYIEEFENWEKAEDRQKQLYLLSGDKFVQAWQWKEGLQQQGGDITGKESDFFRNSKEFWEKVKKAFPDECNYEAIIQAMNYWTAGLEHFNDIIFEIATEYQEPPAMGTEKDWMGDLVTSHLSRFCQPDSIEKQFMDDNDPNIDRFRLICSYQKILQNEAVTFDESPEHKKLADMCLIIKNQKDNKLRILNKIYESIFNQEWVNKIFDYICPYAKEFQAWQSSGCQDESLLLKGENLQTAINWIQNKEQLSKLELEFEFIITSLVWEKWSSGEVVNKVKEFLPQLQKKTKTPAHLVRVIQAILEGTRPQLVLLQAVLQWVREAEVIPTEDEAKWLKGVVRSHIQDFSAEKLSKYLDYNNPSKAIWQQLKDENAFRFIDEFIHKYCKRKQPSPQDNEKQPCPSMEEINNVKNYKVILDKYQASSHNRHDTESVTNFQQLVSSNLFIKFTEADKMAGQKEFDRLLDEIVEKSGEDLKAVLIFNLKSGYVQYHNKKLEENNRDLYQILYGTGDGGKASQNLKNFTTLQNDLDSFGEQTNLGGLDYCMFKLTKGIMVAYFLKLSDTTLAICFIAPEGIRPGIVDFHCSNNIQKIKDQLKDF